MTAIYSRTFCSLNHADLVRSLVSTFEFKQALKQASANHKAKYSQRYSRIIVGLSHVYWAADRYRIPGRQTLILIVVSMHINTDNDNDYQQYHRDRYHYRQN